MPKLKDYKVEAVVEMNVEAELPAASRKQAVERMEYLIKNLRWLWKNVRFPRAKEKHDVYIVESDVIVDIEDAEPVDV